MTLLSTAEARDLATEFVNAIPSVSLVLEREGTLQAAQTVVYAYPKRQPVDRIEATAKETDVDVTFYRLDSFNAELGDLFAWTNGATGVVRRVDTHPVLTMLYFAEATIDIGTV